MTQELGYFKTILAEIRSEPEKVDSIPYELLLYRRGYFDSVNYLELPHVLSMFYEIILEDEAEAAKLARLNAEIAARFRADKNEDKY